MESSIDVHPSDPAVVMQTPSETPLVSIVSVNFNQPELTRIMMQSLKDMNYPTWELLLVDNGSSKGDIKPLKKEFPDTHLFINPDNLGFAGGNNLAFPHCKGKYVLMLNNDTEVDPDFLQPLVDLMEQNPDVGVVSPKLFYFDNPDILQFAGTTPMHPVTMRGSKIGNGKKDDGSFDQIRETGFANGACMLIRKELLDELGYMYEPYFLYYEEHDLCSRIERAGYRIMFHPGSRIWHKVSASTGALSPLKTHYLHRNRLVYLKRNRSGLTKLAALAYYWLVATPREILKHLNSPKHLDAIWRSVKWSLRNRRLPADPPIPTLQPISV